MENFLCNVDLKSCLKCIWGYVDCFLLLDSLLMTLMTFEVDVRIWHIPTNACIMTRFFLSLNLQVNVWVEYDRLCFIQFNTHSYPSTLYTSTFFVGCGWWKKYRERASEWVNATTTTNKDTLFCFVLAKFDTNHSLFIFISLFLFIFVFFSLLKRLLFINIVENKQRCETTNWIAQFNVWVKNLMNQIKNDPLIVNQVSATV